MTRLAPLDLAGAFKKRGLDASTLTSAKHAAKAILEAGGKDAKKTAEHVRGLDDASLGVIRSLLAEPKPSTQPVNGNGIGGSGVNRFKLESDLATTSRPIEAETARALYKSSMKTPGRPFERFLLHAGRLHDELTGPNASQMLTDSKMTERVRKHLFNLQALVRFYEDKGPSKGMESVLASVKQLEDAMGAFGYASDIQNAAKTIEGLPASAQRTIDRNVDDARKALAKVLKDGWSPDKEGRCAAINDIVDTCAKIDFGSEKKDRAFVKERLSEMCADVAKKLPELDMNNLEEGVHELRRQLRWIPITMIALDGLVSLDLEAGGKFAELKTQPVALTPFAKLPPASGTDKAHVDIPWPLFLALSQAIGDLGKIKDRGQLIEGIAHALGAHESAHAEAEALLKDPSGMEHVHEDAARLAGALEKNGLLDRLARAFDA